MTHRQNYTVASEAATSATVAPTPAATKVQAKARKARTGPPRRPQQASTKGNPKKKARTKSTAAASAREVAAPRRGSKGAQIVALLRRPQGASLAELRKASGWQAHSVRGFLSTAAKRYNLRVESTKSEGSDRMYHVK